MRDLSLNDLYFIVIATRWTIALSAIAFAGGSIGGMVVALARTGRPAWLRYLSAGYIRLFQGTPLLMQLFLVFFGINILGLSVDPWTAASLGLTLNASAFLGEIWRGCIEAVPKGQWEAATALGLRHAGLMRYVILPQAGKIAVAPTVGFLVQLIKATSLASIIGFVELTRSAQVINNAAFQPFTIFGLVALIYFLMCWPLSLLSRRMEKRLAVGSR
ncbi:MAG: amino acid ABC transporter permease [Alphaproteobacteria bacterium]